MEIKLAYINQRKRQLNHFCRILAFAILMIPVVFADQLLAPFISRFALGLVSPFIGTILYYLMLLLFFVFLVKQIDNIIPFKNRTIRLSEDRITLQTKSNIATFDIADIDSLTFVKDLPYKNDKRWETQKKSSLKFTHRNERYHLEIDLPTRADFDAIRPIVQAWKASIKDYKQVWG